MRCNTALLAPHHKKQLHLLQDTRCVRGFMERALHFCALPLSLSTRVKHGTHQDGAPLSYHVTTTTTTQAAGRCTSAKLPPTHSATPPNNNAQPNDSVMRSAIKGITWRVFSTTMTIAIALVVFADSQLQVADVFKFGAAEVLVKFSLYFLHERLWASLCVGRSP